MPSLPWKVTVTAWLCQPFASGGRAVPVAPGAVASYLSGTDAGVVFPALSLQVPLTVVAAVSGPAYVAVGEQDSSPDVSSVPAKPTLSAWLYQPFASAARDGVAVADGAVLSILNVFETVVTPPSLSAVHVSCVPVVLAVSVTVLQPFVERMIDSGSTTDQLTVTLLVYQPPLPSVPETTGVTTGGVGSPGTSGTPGAPGARSSAPTPRTIRAARRPIARGLSGHDERAASQRLARIAGSGDPPEPGPHVPAVRPGFQPIAAPLVSPRSPQSEARTGGPSTQDATSSANQLDVVVGRMLNGRPDQVGRSLDLSARCGTEQRSGPDEVELALRPIRCLVDAADSVLVLLAYREAGIAEARRVPTEDHRLALTVPTGRPEHFDDLRVGGLPPCDVGASVSELRGDREQRRWRRVVLERERHRRHVPGAVRARAGNGRALIVWAGVLRGGRARRDA